MSIPREWFAERTLYLVRAGSHAYGTNITEEEARQYSIKPSDEDYIRIIYERPEELLIPAYAFKTQVLTNPDEQVFSVREFIRLLSKGNPNVLETLWASITDKIIVHPVFDLLLDARSAFISKKLYGPYRGYATQQYHRYMRGDQSARQGGRREMIDRFGYDTKAASHIVRLCIQGATVLLKGYIPTRLPEDEARLVKDIRLGRVGYEDVIRLIDEWMRRLDEARDQSTLPDEPDWRTINMVTLEIHKEMWNDTCVKGEGYLELRLREGS